MTTDAPMIDDATIPQFPRGVRLRHDQARNEWVLLAPERLVKCDPIAAAVLQEIDGTATFGQIIDQLCAKYKAEREQITRDVTALLAGLRDKKMVVL